MAIDNLIYVICMYICTLYHNILLAMLIDFYIMTLLIFQLRNEIELKVLLQIDIYIVSYNFSIKCTR